MNKLEELKGKLKAHPQVSRVLKAKNYPTLSFTYRDIGRFQIRQLGNGDYEIWLNKNFLAYRQWLNVKKVLEVLDIVIDNDQELHRRANMEKVPSL